MFVSLHWTIFGRSVLKTKKRFSHCQLEMMTNLFPLGESCDLTSAVKRAAQLITGGGVIAIPTDTVYGLAAAVQNNEAVMQLYKIKGRNPSKPIAICVAGVEAIAAWGKVDVIPSGLLEALLPGPVTVVLQRTAQLNPLLNPGVSKVGIRVPDHSFVRSLCTETRTPLALTSANMTDQPSCLLPEEFGNLWPQLAAVFHNGAIGDSPELRAGSTVVDLATAGQYHVLRPGSALHSTEAILKQFGLARKNL